eukprot:2784024-Rhodomonas_salina.1
MDAPVVSCASLRTSVSATLHLARARDVGCVCACSASAALLAPAQPPSTLSRSPPPARPLTACQRQCRP